MRFVPAASLVLVTMLACSKNPVQDKPKAEVTEVVDPTATASATSAPTGTAPNPTTAMVDAGSADAAPATAEEAYVLTPANTKVNFTGSKVGGSHNGSYGKFTGNLHLVPGSLEQSKIDLEVDTNSLRTDSPKLDAHLKSADFFDVEKFPKARFKSTALKPSEAKGATHTLTGVMEIKGIKKTLSFPVNITVKDDALSAKADFVISRKAFKIDFDGAADYLIKDEVLLSLKVDVPRKK
ncbi:MAG: YceI family protein [Polyangiaceae bacterium]